MNVQKIYSERFSDQDLIHKQKIWQLLCKHFFQRYVRDSDTVLDIAAGYCEFINNIKCARKIALDINPDTTRMRLS